MYARREKQKPFRPSASYNALDVPLEKFEKPVDVDPEDDHRVKKPADTPDFPMMVDAETGEPLKYTRAKWNAKEGRLSLTARTILDMGTGKLDIKNRTMNNFDNGTNNVSSNIVASTSNVKRNPIIEEFLNHGPLTPMYHIHWNSLTNTVEDPNAHKLGILNELNTTDEDASGIRTWSSIDEASIMSSSSSYLYGKPIGRPLDEAAEILSQQHHNKHHTSANDDSNNNKSATIATATTQQTTNHNVGTAERFPLPIDLQLLNAKNWETLFAKTYSDLITLTSALERNKFLTKQVPYPGGMSALRRICKSLSTLRVNQMRELVQAIDDEAERDQKREQAERERFDQHDMLQDLKKLHREQRKIGKQYIESLQRDHEVKK